MTKGEILKCNKVKMHRNNKRKIQMINGVQMLRCNMENILKPLSEFHKKDNFYGTSCKECRNKTKRKKRTDDRLKLIISDITFLAEHANDPIVKISYAISLDIINQHKILTNH